MLLDYASLWQPPHLFACRIERRPLYKYQPLRQWQTRLIRLLPGSLNAPIECELFAADVIAQPGFGVLGLGQVVEYEAVSYSWGWPKRTASIICNNHTSFIPPTLKDALRYLRRVHEQRWLWCDALCINQDDPAEKSRQVQMMLLIFSKAKRVVAWLGLSNDAAEKSLLRKAGESQRQVFASCDQMATDQLVGRPWFSRTWVRQEVFAARNLTLQVEDVCCDWDSFSSFIWNHAQTGSGNLKSLRQVYSSTKPSFPEHPIRAPHNYVPESGRAGSLAQVRLAKGLLSIMTDNQYFEVSEDRDRVYGLLGLLQSRVAGGSEAMPVDCSRTVEQVYEDFTKYLVNVTGSLDFLSVFRYPGTNRRLASWALDWRVDCNKMHLIHLRDFSTTFLGEARPQLYEDAGRLRVTGRCLGIVSDLAADDQFKQQHGPVRHVDIVLDPCEPWLVDLIISGSYASRHFRFPGSDVSSTGIFLAAPTEAEADDLVVELEGSQLPLLLRKTHTTTRTTSRYEFSLIGPVWFQFLRDEPWQRFFPEDCNGDVANILDHRLVHRASDGLMLDTMAEFAGKREFCERYQALLADPPENHYLI